MVKIKNILSSLERHKGKIMKVFIFSAIVKFYISAFYRMYEDQESRKQMEITVTLYSLLALGLVFFNEFFNCLVPKFVEENFKIITSNLGKGLLFIFISIIFMNPLLGNQQVYSGYLLFCVGILSIIANFNLVSSNNNMSNNSSNAQGNQNGKLTEIIDFENKNTINAYQHPRETNNVNTVQADKAKSTNPFDMPDDF